MASPSAWTTASSGWWSPRTAATASAFFGWEVKDGRHARRIRGAAGTGRRHGHARQPRARRRAPRGGLIAFADPLDNRLEIFHGRRGSTTAPFTPGRTHLGLPHRAARHGARGAACEGHQRRHPVLSTDVLGFHLSRLHDASLQRLFLPRQSAPHSIAFIETGRNATHHLMVELYNLDDVGQGYDLALGEEGRVGVTLGRQINDEVTSFYSNSPSGFMVEYGWAGRVIEPQGWQPEEVSWGPSMWVTTGCG